MEHSLSNLHLDLLQVIVESRVCLLLLHHYLAWVRIEDRLQPINGKIRDEADDRMHEDQEPELWKTEHTHEHSIQLCLEKISNLVS